MNNQLACALKLESMKQLCRPCRSVVGPTMGILLGLSFVALSGTPVEAADPSEAITVPFTYVDNRMVVDCMIDGQGPFAMIVDTGAPDITITPEQPRG